MPSRPSPEYKDLALKVGKFIQYWGFKRVHGEIWTYIFLAETPVDASQLVKHLGVSKALVSLAVKDLMKYNVIRVAGSGRGRKILLEANPDPSEVITGILRQRESVLIRETQKSFEALQALPPHERADVKEKRLEELGAMISMAENVLTLLTMGNVVDELEKVGLSLGSKNE